MTFEQFQKTVTSHYGRTLGDFSQEDNIFVYQWRQSRIVYNTESKEWRFGEGRGDTLNEAEADEFQKYELAWS